MGQDFLTLEGVTRAKKRKCCLGILSIGEDRGLGANPRLSPAFKAAQVAQTAGKAYSARMRENELDTETRDAERQGNTYLKSRLDVVMKEAYTPGGSGGGAPAAPGQAAQPSTTPWNQPEEPDMFQTYMSGYLAAELAGYEGDGLDGFFSSFKRMVTPPAKVRQAFKKVVRYIPHVAAFNAIKRTVGSQAFKGTIGKGLRMAGAAISVLPAFAFVMPPSMRNKMFGLKGNEIKAFDAATKVVKIATIATVAVVGGGAIMGAMGPMAGTGLSGFLAKKGASDLLLKQGAGILVKDSAKGGIWKIIGQKAASFAGSKMGESLLKGAAQAAGSQLVGAFVPKSQIPAEAYANLPDNTPFPMPAGSPGSQVEMPSRVAGSSSMAPGGESYPPEQFGEEKPYDQGALVAQAEDNRQEGFGVPFPNAMTPDPDASPAESETPAAGDFDAQSPAEMIAEAKAESAEESGPPIDPAFNEATAELEGAYEDAVAQVKARTRARMKSRAKKVKAHRAMFAAQTEAAKFRPAPF